MSCLYILKINPLSVALFADLFSQSKGYLFILFRISLALQKFSSLIRSHLFICFYFHYSGDEAIKYCCNLFQSVLPLFSSKSFIISSLTFRSLIHFELIFVYGIRECSSFICLHVAVPIFPAPLIKENVFSPTYILASSVVN